MFVIGLAQKGADRRSVAPLAQVVFDQTPHPSVASAGSACWLTPSRSTSTSVGIPSWRSGSGLARDFTFPRNFRPYTAADPHEFWRRWHISLSAWLRDYLYIPLGGSRFGVLRTYRNLLTVFLLCGLWHGASWNFVLWGVWHGAFLVIERGFLGRLLSGLAAPVRWAYTLLVVMMDGCYSGRTTWTVRSNSMTDSAGLGGGKEISFDVHMALNPGTLVPLIAGCALAAAALVTGAASAARGAGANGPGFNFWPALPCNDLCCVSYSPFLTSDLVGCAVIAATSDCLWP